MWLQNNWGFHSSPQTLPLRFVMRPQHSKGLVFKPKLTCGSWNPQGDGGKFSQRRDLLLGSKKRKHRKECHGHLPPKPLLRQWYLSSSRFYHKSQSHVCVCDQDRLLQLHPRTLMTELLTRDTFATRTNTNRPEIDKYKASFVTWWPTFLPLTPSVSHTQKY